jgi:hypothetical protein
MHHKFSEKQTHKKTTNSQLEQAGWYLRHHSRAGKYDE